MLAVLGNIILLLFVAYALRCERRDRKAGRKWDSSQLADKYMKTGD